MYPQIRLRRPDASSLCIGIGLEPGPLLDRQIRQARTFLKQFTDIYVGMVLESLRDARFTYFWRESHLTFLPFASALHATIARFKAILSALEMLAASAEMGINTVPRASVMAIRHANRALAKRDIIHLP